MVKWLFWWKWFLSSFNKCISIILVVFIISSYFSILAWLFETVKEKTVTKYSKDTLTKCIHTVRSGKMTLQKVSKHFKIPYSMLHDNKIHKNKIFNNKTYKKKSGGQNAFWDNLGSYIVKTWDLLTTWKVPFDGYSVRCLVKSYLNNVKLNIKKFTNSFPGTEWVCSFIQSHKLKTHSW